MAENNNSVATKLQKRINNLTKLRDKLIERNWWLTEPQYSWFAKNNSDLVKWVRKIVKDSWIGEIKERWGDTSLSNPDLPWLTWWNWLRNDKWSFLALAWALWWPLNPFWAATTLTSSFVGDPVVALLPEALWTIRAWARNGKNYLYDLQKQQWWAWREYNQYIQALNDIDDNLEVLWAYRDSAKAVEASWWDYMEYLKKNWAKNAADFLSGQIQDSALLEEKDSNVNIEPVDYTLEWINEQLEKDKKSGRAQWWWDNKYYWQWNQNTIDFID